MSHPYLSDFWNALEKRQDVPLQKGDVAIVLRADGTSHILNVDGDFSPETMTDRQREQGANATKLLLALQLPQVMSLLGELLEDPTIVPQE